MVDLRRVFDDLVRFETVLWAEVDARLRRECELPLGSLNVMMVVDATTQCRVYDIARALEITVGGVSQAVDRLVAAGRCVRRANPADRRSSIVELTAVGHTLLGKAVTVFDEELDRLFRPPLTSGDLEHLGTTLAALRQARPEGTA